MKTRKDVLGNQRDLKNSMITLYTNRVRYWQYINSGHITGLSQPHAEYFPEYSLAVTIPLELVKSVQRKAHKGFEYYEIWAEGEQVKAPKPRTKAERLRRNAAYFAEQEKLRKMRNMYWDGVHELDE